MNRWTEERDAAPSPVDGNPREGCCAYQYADGTWCTEVGSFSAGRGGEKFYCNKHHFRRDSSPDRRTSRRTDDMMREILEAHPTWRPPGTTVPSREYGLRMIGVCRGITPSISRALRSPAQPGPADESARRASIERASDVNEALHPDLPW